VLNPHGLQKRTLTRSTTVAVDGTSTAEGPVQRPTGFATCSPRRPGDPRVYVDIPQHRGTDWGDRPVDRPRTSDAALADAGLVLERGDALCLEWGATGSKRPWVICSAARRPNRTQAEASADGARWVAETQVSILAWDMLDSRDAKEAHATARILTWAIGPCCSTTATSPRLRRACGRVPVWRARWWCPCWPSRVERVNLNPSGADLAI